MASMVVCQFNTPFPCRSPLVQSRSPRLSLHYETIARRRHFGSKYWLSKKSSSERKTLCLFFRKDVERVEDCRKEDEKENDRVPFDLNLAVVLAGFAFEAYTSPPKTPGRVRLILQSARRSICPSKPNLVFCNWFRCAFLPHPFRLHLDRTVTDDLPFVMRFFREVYDGQLFIKLKKGLDLPTLDPWGTSDPYVVIQYDNQLMKSKIKWATKEPVWDEKFITNMRIPPIKSLQIAAWDANLVTPHKRMGNAGITLESLCDGNVHNIEVDLEGLGGGGRILLEVEYKSFEEIDSEKQAWKIPFVSDIFRINGLSSALKFVYGSESVQARQFVEFAFGKLQSLTDLNESSLSESNVDIKQDKDGQGMRDSSITTVEPGRGKVNPEKKEVGVGQSYDFFWKNVADGVNLTLDGSMIQNIGFPIAEKLKWDDFDVISKMGVLSMRSADEEYVESGLAAPKVVDLNIEQSPLVEESTFSLVDLKKLSWDMLRQTDSILSALMVLTSASSQEQKESTPKIGADLQVINVTSKNPENGSTDANMMDSTIGQTYAEEMNAFFTTAESAMEAWAMLATSLGRPSFIKSEFEKICFLDNASTDTQVAIWRDSNQKRLVVAFRGTEQSKWKDLQTDLMLLPAGLNPERVRGDFKQEIQVHRGFLNAYDSVRTRIISLIKTSIDFEDNDLDIQPIWHVYVTGHSLGGALATLLTLELSSSKMAKRKAISISMYNFGSPRVGNKRFAELYNEIVRDSWRIVNHRDIIPTVPRLMGYCHVAQPVYLKARDLKDAMANMELISDGYEGDVIGEHTPDSLVSEFLKGERQLIEKILQTEISLFLSIRDGSALMQHMEDFYYVTLLESVRSKLKTAEKSEFTNDSGMLSA